MKTIKKGSEVEWKWGRSTAGGKVVQKFTAEVERGIKDRTIRRKASREEPAFLIRQDDGDRVLKSRSELSGRHD